MSKHHRYPTITALAILLCGLSFGAAQAATITVDDATDGSTANCTLRDAVASVNNGGDQGNCAADTTTNGYGTNDTINFAATLNGQTIEVANSGHIEITSDITIDALDGSGVPLGIILDANNSNRIFYVSGGSTLTVKGLTFQNGDVSGLASPNTNGGAIWAKAMNHSLTIEDCHFANNKAGYGGAISAFNSPGNSGTLNASNSIFSENTATYDGGAIYVGTATVSSSTFSENKANDFGGAIHADTATVSFSTFYKNTANYGGAIYANNDGTVSASTFSENTANQGGAIWTYDNLDARHLTLVNNTAATGASIFVYGFGGGKTFALHNSIIVGTQSDAHCVAGAGNPSIIGTYNLEWSRANPLALKTTCGTSAPGVSAPTALNQVIEMNGAAPALADNGGTTETLALPAGSPAIGAADKTVNGTSQMWDTTTSAWTDATEDQRGSARKAVGTGRDLGAYEANALLLNGSPLDATVGDTYHDTSIAVTGGTGTYDYTVTRGALPPGLTLDPATGAISGIPTQIGSYDFSVTATDNGTGELTAKGFTIAVVPHGLVTTAVPVLPLPLLLMLAGLLVGVGIRDQRAGIRDQ